MFALLIMTAAIFATLGAGLFLSIDMGREAVQSLSDAGQNSGPTLS